MLFCCGRVNADACVVAFADERKARVDGGRISTAPDKASTGNIGMA